MTLLDAKGKPIRHKLADCRAVVMVSDDGEYWVLLPGYNVPATIRDPEVMSWMLDGEVIETAGGKYFRAERVES